MPNLRRLLLAGAVLALLAVATAAAVAWSAWRELNTALALPADGLMLEIPAGASLGGTAADLSRRGVLDRPRLLSIYARLTGAATRIQAGEYWLAAGTTPISLLAKLVAGEVYLHRLTIVEGWRFADLIEALKNHPAIDAAGLDAAAVMAALGEPELHPEGQFLPDTYRFAKGTAALELLGQAHAALQAALSDIWARRAADIALETPYQALILASIIEKETALATERALISGVFHRRLQRGMRLGTDPTVIYGLGDAFDGDLRRRDLSRDTPYNTYTRRGLPPTPIALAGRAAIEAAVAPADGDALYFVATGDGDGSHRFSASLEEHNQAVRDFLRRSRERAD